MSVREPFSSAKRAIPFDRMSLKESIIEEYAFMRNWWRYTAVLLLLHRRRRGTRPFAGYGSTSDGDCQWRLFGVVTDGKANDRLICHNGKRRERLAGSNPFLSVNLLVRVLE